MEQQPDSPGPKPDSPPETPREEPRPVYDPDPEIDALLHFKPVHRHTRRHDGWSPAVQRGFIANLARTGSAEHAAAPFGRTSSGAWKLRSTPDGQEFADSWDLAIDLWHARNPDKPRRGGRARGAWRPAPEPEPQLDEEAQWQLLSDTILTKYILKLEAERVSRLAGRIVEADFYVRQLIWLEVALDLSGRSPDAVELLKGLTRGEHHAGDIAATPMSLLLDDLRRLYWKEQDEPERPPLPSLGPFDEDKDYSLGPPQESQYWPDRDGPPKERETRLARYQQENAEAQRLWEEKARADAAAWRERSASDPSGSAFGSSWETGDPPDGGGAASDGPEEDQP